MAANASDSPDRSTSGTPSELEPFLRQPHDARQPVLDLDQTLARLEGDTDFLKELFRLFGEDAPQRMSSLDQAISGNDLATAAKAAHSLKGMGGTIGAPRLTELSQQLETTAKVQDEAQAAFLLGELRNALDQVLAAIDAYLAG